jgi:hypothetical protein
MVMIRAELSLTLTCCIQPLHLAISSGFGQDSPSGMQKLCAKPGSALYAAPKKGLAPPKFINQDPLYLLHLRFFNAKDLSFFCFFIICLFYPIITFLLTIAYDGIYNT